MSRARLRAVAALVVLLFSAPLFATDYTWTGGGDDNGWRTPENWGETTKYPGNGDRMIFPEGCTAEVELGAVNNYEAVSYVRVLAGASVRFYAADPDAQTRLDMKGSWELNYAGNSVEFDHIKAEGNKNMTLGGGATLVLKNGSELYVNAFAVDAAKQVSLLGGSTIVSSGAHTANSSVGTLLVVDGSTWNSGDFTLKNTATNLLLNGATMNVNSLTVNGAGTFVSIDDSTFVVRGNFNLGDAAPGGGRFLFKGAHPLLKQTGGGYFKANRSNADMTAHFDFDFLVPEGGFAEVPVWRSTGQEAYRDNTSIPAGYFRFNVLASSPAVTAGTRTDCPLFFSSQSGITRERMANGDDETATLRFADYPGETEAISTATAKAVYATIGSGGGAVRAAAHGAIENYSATARTQHTITATGRATALANGGATTRMELWGGTENDAATMALADTAYPAALGEFSATYTEPVHTQDQTYYLQFRVVDTDISGATNYTCAGEIFNATIVDSAAYTWTGAGSDDKWSNPDNWADDQGGDCVGAPISSGSTARILKTATVDLDVTATIAKLDLAATGADVVLTSSSTVDYRLTLNGLDLPRDNSVWTIDGAYVTRAADVTTTPGSRVVIKNGGYFYLNSLHPKAANSVWEVGEGGTNSVANLYIAAGGACVISNGYMNCRGNLYLTDNSAGGELVLKGTHPSLSMSNNSGYFRSSFATPAATLGFEVPEGGYDAPPITGASGNTRTFFDTASSAGVSISVLGSSGAYRGAAATKTTLVRWVKGYSSYLTFAPLATADAGGGFAVENTTDLTVTVYPGDRSDRLTVISAHGTPSPAVGVHTGYADGAESTLSAGSVVEVSASERYVPVGWKRYSVDPFTVERTLVDSGDGDALEYVHPGEWTAVEWLWRRDCAATATTDGHGTAAVSAEWTDEDSFATATATPSDGFRFSYWSGDVVDVPILENPAKFPGDRPRALVANFVAADAEVATNRYTGAKDGSWNTDGNWSLGHVPTAEEAVEIPSGKGTVKITNEGRCASLRIVSDSSLQLLGSGAVAGGQIRLDVRGDAVSFGPNLTLGNGTVHDYDVLFNVGGDLCISNNNKAAKMLVYAGDAYGTNANAVIAAGFAGETAAPRIRDYWRGGAQVNVGGKLFLGGSHSSNVSTLEIYSHYKTGLSPVFRVGSLEIGEKGAVNGSSYGWRSYNGVGWFGLGSSRRAGSNGYWGGASYGGEGGRPTVADAGSGGATYGFENAPCWPGSAGGANGSDGGYGGSLFRVHAQGAAKIDGAVSVNGSAWNQTGRGGGAGGGVWITCDTFEAGASAKISAKGGGNSAANGSAGGGGRVVVATGCTSDGDIRAFLETGACAGYTAADFSATLWPSLIDVSGGVNYAALAVHNDWNDGSAGTAKFLQNANGKAILTVAGSPVAVGAADPAYVTHVVDEGDAACVNDEYGYVPGTSNGTRYALDGYVWTNSVANGSGSGTTAVVPALGETTLVWLWRDKAHNLDATSGGYGSVSAHDEWIADGERVTLTATPGEGAVFVRWIGDIDAADAANAGITFTMTAPRRLVAVFDKPAAAPRALTYSGGDWFDPATWDGTAIPGTNDAVTASSALSFPFGGTIDVGSLDIPGGALSVAPVQGAYNAEAASDFDTPLALHVHGDFSVGGSAVLSIGSLDGDIRTDIIVDGDMTVSGTATIQAYASVGEADGSLRTWRHYKAGGASVSVGGDLMIDGSARVFNHCHGQSGVGVVWHAGGDVTIGENAQFNGSIWSAENNSYGYGWRFPNGINIVAEGAGSHGGAGGGRDASTTYGYACAPFLPGSPGNGNKSEEKGEGGGTVRIDAGGTVALNGKIYVTGGSNNGGGNNAGAGGSVWITCGAFEPGAAALVNARGGRSNQHSACRGGGGGRVSIITGSPTEEQLDSLYATGAAEDVIVVAGDMGDELVSPWPTLADVRGGTCNDQASNASSDTHGKIGTAVYLQNAAGRVIVTVTGDQDTVETTPAYGQNTVETGVMTFSAPAFIYRNDGLSRYPCVGYEWRDVTGESGSGEGTTFSVDVRHDLTVTWRWGTIEHYLDVRDGGLCTVAYAAEGANAPGWYDEGTLVRVACAPADVDTTFVAWLGDVDDSVKGNPVVDVLVDAPKTIVATLRRDAARARALVWTGQGDGIDWFDKANWDGLAIPGKFDSVLVTNGTFQARYPAEIEVASFAVTNATGYLFCRTGTSAYPLTGDPFIDAYTTAIDDFDLRPCRINVSGDLSIGGTTRLYCGGIDQGYRVDVSVGGNATLGGGTAKDRSRFQIYAMNLGDWTNLDNYRVGGGSLTVGGRFVLEGYSRFTPAADRKSGAVVPVRATAVLIGANAEVNANARGFGRSFVNPGTGWQKTLYGYATTGSNNFGGTYGGQGGYNDSESFGYEAAPFYPGASGNTDNGNHEYVFSGGGAVRIDAQEIVLEGKILANGYGGWHIGGGSGGGVWLTCRHFALGDAGMIEAWHSNDSGYGGTGGGGGGRIAVGVKFSADQLGRMYRRGALRDMAVTPLADIPEWTGHFMVAGGKGPGDGRNGTAGTAVFVTAPSPGLVLFVR